MGHTRRRVSGWIAGLTLALTLAPAAGAAEAEPLDAIGCPTTPARLVVLGDSLADGLWGAYYRALAKCDTLEVVRLTEVSDGLAKSDPEEWLDRYAGSSAGLETTETDIVIVQVGANDLTAIREGGSRAVYGSDDWAAAYAERAATLAQGLGRSAAALIWLGLPVVGKDSLDDGYRGISEMQRAAAEAAGASFYDIHDFTKFGHEGFVMNGEIAGKRQQLRATDRVHFTNLGYELVAGAIQPELRKLLVKRETAAAIEDVFLQ